MVLTWEVGYRGMFLITDRPPDERQLIKLEVHLPGGTRISAPAMVAWRRPSSDVQGRPSGAGVQFYGIGREETAVWQRYVSRLVEEAQLRASQGGRPPTTASEPEGGRRRHHRTPATFRISSRSLARLHQIYARDVSRGGMFILTEYLVPVGERIQVDVVHPDTHETFVLDCLVRRAVRDGGRTGLGVEFMGMDDARRDQFQRFIERTRS
jgi:Tfp pilus assembly protein PilZ